MVSKAIHCTDYVMTLLLCVALAIGSADGRVSMKAFTDMFAEYKKTFRRTYADDSNEHFMRRQLFHQRMGQIIAHNSQFSSWRAGVNHLTDRTHAELLTLRGYKRMFADESETSLLEVVSSTSSCASHQQSCAASSTCCQGLVCGSRGLCEEEKELPADIDWSEKLPSSKVWDQGDCGSCWAMTAASNIQMQVALNSNSTFTELLSPQGMLGCTPNPKSCGGSGGCGGATSELAFQWAKEHGIQQIDKQAYTASSICPSEFLKAKPTVSIDGFVKLRENQAAPVMNALVVSGPLSVAVSADNWPMYASGVFDGCKSTVVDHAVLLVGFGADKGKLYWKIRNSWGPEWGEKGFIRLQRFTPRGEEPCGWDMSPELGVGCKGGPKKLWVCGACGVLSDVVYPVGAQVKMQTP